MALITARARLLRRAAPDGWAALAFFLAAFALYAPALNRVFVNDQIWYFAELGGRASLLDGLRHYDYAVTRVYWKGDDALFRPLLFVWLAIANSLFSYHHVWWNAANIALHALVVVFLFRLLLAIRPSPFALWAAVLFLVMKPSLELVLWHHLGGYLLGCLCLLIGLRAFIQLTERLDPRPARSIVAAYALSLTAASLFYEVMAVVAFFAGLILLWVEWRRWRRPAPAILLASGIPVVLFSLLYVRHLFRVERLAYVDRANLPGILDFGNLASSVSKVPEVLARWMVEVAVPQALDLRPIVFGRLVKEVRFSWLDPLHLLSAGLFSVVVVAVVTSVSRKHLARRLPLLVLLASSLLAYTAVLGLGRPPTEILAVTYYLYVFCLLVVVAAYALTDFDAIGPRAAVIAGIGAVAFMGVHASGTRAVAADIGRANRDASTYLTIVSRFVDDHRAEAGFSFALATHPPNLDPDVVLHRGYPDDVSAPVRVQKLTEILFERYYSDREPRYIIRGR